MINDQRMDSSVTVITKTKIVFCQIYFISIYDSIFMFYQFQRVKDHRSLGFYFMLYYSYFVYFREAYNDQVLLSEMLHCVCVHGESYQFY